MTDDNKQSYKNHLIRTLYSFCSKKTEMEIRIRPITRSYLLVPWIFVLHFPRPEISEPEISVENEGYPRFQLICTEFGYLNATSFVCHDKKNFMYAIELL